jgi:hypothetical protein
MQKENRSEAVSEEDKKKYIPKKEFWMLQSAVWGQGIIYSMMSVIYRFLHKRFTVPPVIRFAFYNALQGMGCGKRPDDGHHNRPLHYEMGQMKPSFCSRCMPVAALTVLMFFIRLRDWRQSKKMIYAAMNICALGNDIHYVPMSLMGTSQ